MRANARFHMSPHAAKTRTTRFGREVDSSAVKREGVNEVKRSASGGEGLLPYPGRW